MATFMIKANDQQLQEIKQLLDYVGEKSNLYIVRAINTMLSKAKKNEGAPTLLLNQVMTILNVQEKVAKKTFSVSRASILKPTGRLRVKDAPLPVIALNKCDAKIGGVEIQAKKNSGTKFIKDAFMATMPYKLSRKKSLPGQGHFGVFMRVTTGLSRTKSDWIGVGRPIGQPAAGEYFRNPARWDKKMRLPIKEMYTTDVRMVAGDVLSDVMPAINESFSGHLKDEAQLLIEKRLNEDNAFNPELWIEVEI